MDQEVPECLVGLEASPYVQWSQDSSDRLRHVADVGDGGKGFRG